MAIVHLTGNIGKDAQLRQIGNNTYACFNVADTERYNSNGQTQERTSWYSCIKADPNGKLTPYLTSGTKVYVTGKISIKEFTASDGTVKKYPEVWVNELDFMQRKEAQPQQQSYQPQQKPQQRPQNVKDLYDYATGGQAHNVRQNAPQTANNTSDELPF